MTRKEILKVIISVLIAALTALAAGLGLSSCNVTRPGPSQPSRSTTSMVTPPSSSRLRP